MSASERQPEATLADFVPMQDGRTRLLVRRGWEDAAEHLSDPDQLRGEETVSGGREAHPVVTLPNGARVVVRGYRRGGMLRFVNHQLYFGGNRAFDELRATERAAGGGVRTPTVIAAIERPARLAGYRAWLATLLVPEGRDLAEWLASSGASEELRRAVLSEAGRQLGLMHRAGVGHVDVNLRNLLVRDTPAGSEVYLLDFDKAELLAPPLPVARRERDLRRMARSARKLQAGLSPAEWEALKFGYGEDWPPSLDDLTREAGAPAAKPEEAAPPDAKPAPKRTTAGGRRQSGARRKALARAPRAADLRGRTLRISPDTPENPRVPHTHGWLAFEVLRRARGGTLPFDEYERRLSNPDAEIAALAKTIPGVKNAYQDLKHIRHDIKQGRVLVE